MDKVIFKALYFSPSAAREDRSSRHTMKKKEQWGKLARSSCHFLCWAVPKTRPGVFSFSWTSDKFQNRKTQESAFAPRSRPQQPSVCLRLTLSQHFPNPFFPTPKNTTLSTANGNKTYIFRFRDGFSFILRFFFLFDFGDVCWCRWKRGRGTCVIFLICFKTKGYETGAAGAGCRAGMWLPQQTVPIFAQLGFFGFAGNEQPEKRGEFRVPWSWVFI